MARHCVSQNAPVEYKNLEAAILHKRAGPAEDDPLLYKYGSKPVQAVCDRLSINRAYAAM